MNAVQRDLAGWPIEKLTEHSAVLHLGEESTVTFRLRQKRLFMASVHSCEFMVEGPVSQGFHGSIRAQQTGWIKRRPVTFIGKKGNNLEEIAHYLNQFPNLLKTLSELDYRRFTLSISESRWRCVIEPWAASEVICRLPPVRRYLRLEQQQRMLLLSVMKMTSQAMAMFVQQQTGN